MSDERKARAREMSMGLLRQRRNLLLISVLMPLFFISGANIEKINILGTIITIQNPMIVKYSLIILFLYFSLRYWQYYKEENYIKDMNQKIHRYLYYWQNSYLNKKAREKANFLNSKNIMVYFSDQKYNLGGRYTAIPNSKDKYVFPFSKQSEFYIFPTPQSQGHKDKDIKIFHSTMAEPEHSGWKPLFTTDEKNENNVPSYYRHSIDYNFLWLNLMKYLGACKYMIKESYFTDYQFPFFIAAFSALATVYAKII